MPRGNSLPNDQAEIVFTDAFVEYLAELTDRERVSVLIEVQALTTNPMGKHPLSNTTQYGTLADFNTLEVLGGERRVVFRARRFTTALASLRSSLAGHVAVTRSTLLCDERAATASAAAQC